MGEYQNGDDLCLDHIKIYDEAINILNVGRTIYPVGHSQISLRSTLTLNILTANHSREQFCFAFIDHRPSIDRLSDHGRVIFGSGDHRPMIRRPFTNGNTCIHVHA